MPAVTGLHAGFAQCLFEGIYIPVEVAVETEGDCTGDVFRAVVDEEHLFAGIATEAQGVLVEAGGGLGAADELTMKSNASSRPRRERSSAKPGGGVGDHAERDRGARGL